MQHSTLSLDDVLAPGAAFHFARTVLGRARPKRLHDHDFHEIFWLHNGRARHHLGDHREVLTEGDLLFIRPADRHALQGIGEDSHLVNIVLPRDFVTAFLDRHPAARPLLMPAGPEPARRHLDMRALSRLSQRAVALESARRDALHLEAFLLPLIAELTPAGPDLPDTAPDWLGPVLVAARRPEVFRDGAAGLVRASGKAHAHVSRTVRKFLGQTPSDLVNAIRMEHAARRLAGTTDPLSEIAEETGIANMSHFHRLFRETHGMTPRQYRLRHQKSVVQPV